MIDLSRLNTEKRNPDSANIDELSTLEMIKVINQADTIPAKAVGKVLPQIATAVDIIADALKNGGRLFYIGAGTSGRLGILDAVECPPTYGTDFSLVQGIIAGGNEAIFRAKEGAEDSDTLAAKDLKERDFTAKDILVGVAASGRTPYVIGGLNYANSLGAFTIAVACSANSPMEETAKLAIVPITGAEVITGSTRMKAGTAQKMILNMLSTATMIKLGKVYGNLMVDVKPSNLKLEERARRIVMEATGCDRDTSINTLATVDGYTKAAILMLLTHKTKEEVLKMLADNDGYIKKTLKVR